MTHVKLHRSVQVEANLRVTALNSTPVALSFTRPTRSRNSNLVHRFFSGATAIMHVSKWPLNRSTTFSLFTLSVLVAEWLVHGT